MSDHRRPLSGGKPHPRTYAAFPRFIARYVREKRLLTLEEAVRKMTSSTALKLRMKRKGFIMPGMDADMVVFGENRIRDVNTFENPRVYPEGIDYVLVNGEIAVDHGVHTARVPARPYATDHATDGAAVSHRRGRPRRFFVLQGGNVHVVQPHARLRVQPHENARSVPCLFFFRHVRPCAPPTASAAARSACPPVRGMETYIPSTTGENQIASEKVYPVDYSHFNINGRSFGAMGAPLDANRATIYHVGLEREIGTLNPVKLAL